jgi:hypothetical protein
VAQLPGVPVVRLALPSWQGGAGRPALRRRAALGLALLGLAVLAVLVAAGTFGLPGAGSATGVPGRSPRTAATEPERASPQAQPRAAPDASEARPPPDRVVAPTHASALFAQHSWHVAPPPPPPAPPPPAAPPPEPTAPPFPYTLVGSFSPGGDPPVFFLARGDRVIDARVGDRLDGVYRFESAAGGQLVFVYLPLDIRQNLTAGGAK